MWSSLTEVLEVNWIILYFVYGQVFFVTGLVTGLQWRRHSHLELARPLPWLAAFGIAHGLNEWGYIFIPLQALYLQDAVVRLMVIAHLLLLAVSYFFLFQFGVELVLPLLPRQRWLRAVPAVVLLLWGVAVFLRGAAGPGPAQRAGRHRRWLGPLPSVLPRRDPGQRGPVPPGPPDAGHGPGRIATYLTGAAIAFLVYALVGGLIVPTAPVFPANLLNYALLDRNDSHPGARLSLAVRPGHGLLCGPLPGGVPGGRSTAAWPRWSRPSSWPPTGSGSAGSCTTASSRTSMPPA